GETPIVVRPPRGAASRWPPGVDGHDSPCRDSARLWRAQPETHPHPDPCPAAEGLNVCENALRTMAGSPPLSRRLAHARMRGMAVRHRFWEDPPDHVRPEPPQ